MNEDQSIAFDEENSYRQSFAPIFSFEKIWLAFLLLAFCLGAAFSYSYRVDKNPPSTLTLENYKEYLTVDIALDSCSGGGNSYDAQYSVRVGSVEAYQITDLSITLSIRMAYAKFDDSYTYTFPILTNGEAFIEKEMVKVDLSKTNLNLIQWGYFEIEYEVLAVSGGLAYAK